MSKVFNFHKDKSEVNTGFKLNRKAGDSIENKDAFNMGYDAGVSDREMGYENEINDRDQWVNEVLETVEMELTEDNLHDFKEGYWTGYEMKNYYEETGEEAVREPVDQEPEEIIDEEVKAEDMITNALAKDSKYSEEYYYLQDKLLAYERKGIGTEEEYERNKARLAEIQDLEWNEDNIEGIKIYIFPELTDDDKETLEYFDLEYLGHSEDGCVVKGDIENIREFADEYLDYQLVDEYIYDVDDFEIKAEDGIVGKVLGGIAQGVADHFAEDDEDDYDLVEVSFEVPEDLAEMIRDSDFHASDLIYWFRDDFGHEVEISYDDGLLTFYNVNAEEAERVQELEVESAGWYKEARAITGDDANDWMTEENDLAAYKLGAEIKSYVLEDGMSFEIDRVDNHEIITALEENNISVTDDNIASFKAGFDETHENSWMSKEFKF